LDGTSLDDGCSTNRRFTRRAVAAVAGALFWFGSIVAAGSSAAAQSTGASGFAAGIFEPTPSQYSGTLNLERPDVLGHLTPSAGLFFHLVDDPVQLTSPDRDHVRTRIVDERYTVEAGVALGLFDYVEVGLSVPFVAAQTGAGLEALGGAAPSTDPGFGDVRSSLKVTFLKPERNRGLGVAASGVVYAPSGDRSRLMSDGRVRGAPRLSFGWESGDGYRIFGNVAYEFGPAVAVRNYTADGTIRWGLGGSAPLPVDRLDVLTTVFGRDATRVRDSNSADPIEVLGGLRFNAPAGFRIQAGGGAGLSDGVGAPDFRLFTSVTWARVGEDRDGDGILDRHDECPDEPEDEDGYQDDDGCPDLDNDGDGIPDVDDECPDTKGPRGNDGCPVNDRDGDGIVNAKDECPDEPEDEDGYQDEDGCPDPDNDGDGIPDETDDCPMEPETRNGVADEDGCPDESKAEVVEDKIEISEKIYFETNKAVLEERSFDVLSDVAQILKEYDRITNVRIEGHTDSRGAEEYNRRLSRGRARAVQEFLVEQGASPEQLEPVGRGESEPIASNETRQGRGKNRRVEFVITEIDGESVESGADLLEGSGPSEDEDEIE